MKKIMICFLVLLVCLLLTACSIARTEPAPSAQPAPTVTEAESPADPAAPVGPWHLDALRNAFSVITEVFPGYGEFGASMELRSDGRIEWYIGSIGGFGSYTQEGSTLHVDLTQATRVPNGEPEPWSMDFRVFEENAVVYLESNYYGTIVIWQEGDSGELPASGEPELTAPETPGPDLAVIVNSRGDEATVYKLADGDYMDRETRRFTFNGSDCWTDEGGVLWYEKA